MIKLALLSAWHVHTHWFLGELKRSDTDAAIAVVWDDDEERGRQIAGELNVPFESDLHKVLYEYDIQGVMVEYATMKHTDVIIQAANAGKHIFSDKPLAVTVEDCLKIKEAIERSGVKFLLSLETKIVGAYQQAAEMIREGKLGRIIGAHFRRTHGALLNPGSLPSRWFDPKETGGGVTLDLGCHGLYILPMFCGKPKKVTCFMNELYGSGLDENSTTLIEFENGALASAYTTTLVPSDHNLLEILGAEGHIVITGDHEQFLLQSEHVPGYEKIKPLPQEEIWDNEEMPIVKFVRLIESDKQYLEGYGIDTAILLARMIECAYESAETGKAVLF